MCIVLIWVLRKMYILIIIPEGTIRFVYFIGANFKETYYGMTSFTIYKYRSIQQHKNTYTVVQRINVIPESYYMCST